MEMIVFPLEPHMRGPDVDNLQAALQLLLDRAAILRDNEGMRKELSEALVHERAEGFYGDVTVRIVSIFQDERHLVQSNSVDERTAKALNDFLRDAGYLRPSAEAYRITGEVSREDGLLLRDTTVRAFHAANQGSVRLGEDVTDAEGRYTIRYDPLPDRQQMNVRLAVLGPDGTTVSTGGIDHQPRPLEILDLRVPVAAPPPAGQRIEGALLLSDGRPAEQVRLRLYRRDFGGQATLLTETTTLAGGRYALVRPDGTAASLEIRAVQADREVALSEPLNFLDGQVRVQLNLAAPVEIQPLGAEYERLAADLAPLVGGMPALAGAQEQPGRQDLTVLNRETGWDARLISLAATSQRLAADPDVQLPPAAMYGLLRAGLPPDKLRLADVPADVAEQALKTARDAGIIALDDQQIGQVTQQFATFTNNARLGVAVPGSRSTYRQLLQSSGLDQQAQAKFAPVYLNHEGEPAQLWEQARAAGLDDTQIGRLQLQGKLAFLTANSEPLTRRLQATVTTNNPAELPDKGLYRTDPWIDEIDAAAGVPRDRRDQLTAEDRQALETIIPPIYAGATVEARRDLWAEDMARKVRVSYPTQTVAHMIEKDGPESLGLAATGSPTASLLRNAANQGFRLGQSAIDPFFDSHAGLKEAMTEAQFAAARLELRTLQRAYQITPTNDAMAVLLKHNLTSAYDVVALSEEAFLDRYGALFASIEVARLVYRKARQVSSVTYNLFTIAKKLDSEPPIKAISGSPQQHAEAKGALKRALKNYPTMESLFGSMDSCECEHCSSVLSPSAYLVDLLQFIDVEPQVWDGFASHWKQTHNQVAYPHPKPYEVFVGRRPDLPHISLTCDNTKTAMPYIDLVNEILEYDVAHGQLTADAAHDTGNTTTAELLAEPQYVIDQAYEQLNGVAYPMGLPFDLWLETVRQFCDQFEQPLASLLEAFRTGEELFEPTRELDRASIFIESLGLSAAEYALFSDGSVLTDRKWYDLYGFWRARPAIAQPTNTGNATVSIADADAATVGVGDACTYFDTSAAAMGTGSLTVAEVGDPGTGGAGRTKVTFTGVWSTPPEAGDLLVFDAVTAMSSAKALARRLGLGYQELVDVVRSGFVNPELGRLAMLRPLDVTIDDVLLARDNDAFYQHNKDLLDKKREELSTADQQRFDALSADDWGRLREAQAFERRLAAFSQSSGVPLAQVTAQLQAIPFDQILVLADPAAGCDFDLTTVRYASGRPVDDLALTRINLAVRLWRTLGWSLPEVDAGLQTFVPPNAPFDRANLGQQPLRTALIYLAHLHTLHHKAAGARLGRRELATLWSDIPTGGEKPLYETLVLTATVLRGDDVFDDPLGRYLTPTAVAEKADATRYSAVVGGVAPAAAIDPGPFAGRPRVELWYDETQQAQHLTYRGVLTAAEEQALRQLSTSPALPPLLTAVRAAAADYLLVKGHLPALQGALGLTADEIRRILEDQGTGLDTAVLSLPQISVLYRYAVLARALKLTVAELITLKQLSGVDPFTPLHPDPITTLAQDHPFSDTLRFVEVAEQAAGSGLTVADLDYLMRHRFDPNGPYRPAPDATLLLIRTIADGVRAIRAAHALPVDPGGLTEETLRQELGLALPAPVVEQFVAMLNGTAEFTVTKTGVAADDQLDPARFAGEPAIREVRYDPVRQEQQLTFRGVLFDAEKATLKARLPHPVPPAPHDPFGELLDNVQQAARSFFAQQLQKQPANAQPGGGFLDPADYDLLFAPPGQLTPAQSQQRVRQQRARLAQAFLPYLQGRLIRQFIVQTVTAWSSADPALVEALLIDSRLLGVTAAAATRAVLDVLADTADRGTTATFFASTTGDGPPLATVPLPDVDTALTDANGQPLKAAGTNSARIEGYLEVPTPGAYRFLVVLGKQNARAELRLAHLNEPTLTGTAASDGDEVGDGPGEYAVLEAGRWYRFTLDLHNLNDGDARLLVQGETVPKDRIGRLPLTPARPVDAAERAIGLHTKAVQLLQTLGLSAHEAAYLLTHRGDFDGAPLETLAVRDAQAALAAIVQARMAADPTLSRAQATDQARAGNPALAAEADQGTPLFRHVLRLAAYADLRRDIAGGGPDLIEVFQANAAADLDTAYAVIAKLTRRPEATVRAAAALTGAPSFASERPLRRLWEVLKVVERFGVPVPTVAGWARILSRGANARQRAAVVRDLKEALKARFEPAAWQRIAQPIHDRLRRRQRDALVAHVMHQHGFTAAEQLYEYFLIDPGMEPVVQTSRIRLAIGSLQLFVQRCLLNLEPQVHPSAVINAKQWQWMKRYRVWEANRKIFLFPENWLEPEFRDDKSHLFNELESTLLQGDVSGDLVEDAFLDYLRKLEELARLDIVAMHLEDKADPANNTLHVIGRTYSQPHKYFYRRYAHQVWTPWEPVTTEIEGDHLAPVVWRDRLYLFWVTFMTKAAAGAPASSPTKLRDSTLTDTVTALRAVASQVEVTARLHWSEYVNGEWTTHQGSGFTDTIAAKAVPAPFEPGSVFIHVSRSDDGVLVHLGGALQSAFYLAGRNSPVVEGQYGAPPANPYSANTARSTQYEGTGAFAVTFTPRITTEDGQAPVKPTETATILGAGDRFTVVTCDNDLAYGPGTQEGRAEIASLIKPVFYQDSQNTFYVEPTVTEQTIEEWQDWVTSTPRPERGWEKPQWWGRLEVIAQVPVKVPIRDPRDPYRPDVDALSKVKVTRPQDWLINPATSLQFQGQLIGPRGYAGLKVVPADGAVVAAGQPVSVNAGSGIAGGDTVVLQEAQAFEGSGLVLADSGINIVGSGGFNSVLAQNYDSLKQAGFGGPRGIGQQP